MKKDISKIVLVVEDDESMRGILANHIAQYGYEVVQAEDGERAIQEIIRKRPGIILLDLLLPKLDGFSVLEWVRQYKDPQIAKTPVIVLSNLWSNKDILRVQNLHIEEYFVKAQTDLQDVFKKVQSVLSK